MALVLKDRVKVTSTTTGTGTLTLASAVTGYQSFATIGDGNTTYYAITDPATGDWEVGIGTYTSSGTTLSRTTILSSSNAGSVVDLQAGTKEVFCVYPAEKAVYEDAANKVVQNDFVDLGVTGTATINAAVLTTGTISTTPTSGTDIANKTYVDTMSEAAIHYHAPVRVESPTALNATYNNGTAGVGATLTNAGTQAALVVDGITVSVNDRVLVYTQVNQTQNGIYTVTNVGSGSTNWVLTRATDADTFETASPEGLSQGSTVFVQQGVTGAGETYTCNTPGTITFGTTNITFAQISSAQIYSAGTGLTLSGTQFSITPVGTAGTYGSASAVPVITTNASGQVSSVTNTNIDISASQVTSGTLAVARGGTGLSSYTVGALVYASGTGTLAGLADVATGNVLLSGGTNTAPAYGKVGLGTHVSGTLPTANGGTNLTSFTSGGAVYATSTSALTTGTLPVTAGGTGVTTLSGIAFGNGTSAFTAASAAQIVSAIGSTAVTNATNATNATNTVNTGITEDTATATAVYPTWVTANTGNLPQKTTSTKLAFVPSTGVLSATQFSGSGAGLTSIPNSALTNSAVTVTAGTGLSGGGSVSLGSSVTLTNAGVTSFSAGTTGLTPSTGTTGAVTLAGTLAVANGGTGSTTAGGARTSLGATTVGGNLFTLTNPSAVTFPRFNADNTVSTLDAATFRSAIGAGTSSTTGTVTSVSATVPTGLSISGSPITSSGTLAITYTAGYAIPTTASQTNWDTAYSVRQQWDGGSTNLVAATGRTSLGGTTVGQNFFTLTNPTAITFPRINADNTVSALDAATFRTAIGAGTSSTTGTVTSVGGTGTVSGLSLSGTVTTSGSLTLGGTLAVTASNFSSQTANTFLAAPNGAAGVPTFRAVVAADIPTLNQNTTGSSGSCTGNAATATTATTANALNTANNYQVNSLGVGTAGSGTAGEIRATNNITAYYSDERLKTKIGSIDNALEKVKQIETMVYHANETAVELGYDASIIEVGVTAQSVQRVMPQTVAPAPIDDKYLTVRYERLVPLLIEAIKELEAQVAELKAK